MKNPVTQDWQTLRSELLLLRMGQRIAAHGDVEDDPQAIADPADLFAFVLQDIARHVGPTHVLESLHFVVKDERDRLERLARAPNAQVIPIKKV
jgi:hypothetical protein